MRISTQEQPIHYQASPGTEEMSFGIKEQDISHILVLLRRTLYQHPIEAICREVTSNARDANREAGKKDTPITITLGDNPFVPDTCCFMVEDDGPGISPQRMSDVFIAYGASTKRDSDEQTGGFGLGAKTPFAYCNHFVIETCSEGLLYIYAALIAEGNKGRVVLLGKHALPEGQPRPFGTRISVPVEAADRAKFEEKTLKSTLLWDVRPIYKGFDKFREIQDIEMIDMGVMGLPLLVVLQKRRLTNVAFLNGTHDGSGIGCVLDGIPYPVEGHFSFLERARKPECFGKDPDAKWSVSFFVKIKPGEVSLTPSRESFHMDKETLSCLEGKAKEILDTLSTIVTRAREKMERAIDILGVGTPHEEGVIPLADIAVCLYKAMYGEYSLLGEKASGLLQELSIKKISMSLANGLMKANIPRDGLPAGELKILSRNPIVIVHDTVALDSRRNAAIAQEFPQVRKHAILVRVPRGKGFSKKTLEEIPASAIRETLSALGVDSMLYSEVVPIPVEKKKRFQKNCEIFIDRGPKHGPYAREGFAQILEEEKCLLFETSFGLKDKYPLESVRLSEEAGIHAISSYMVAEDSNRRYRGEDASPTHVLVVKRPTVRARFSKCMLSVPKNQTILVREDKGIQKQLQWSRHRQNVEGHDLAMFIAGIDLPRNNELYPLQRQIKKILAWRPSELLERMQNHPSLPSLISYTCPEVLTDLDNKMRNHPLAVHLRHHINYDREEARESFTEFLCMAFRKRNKKETVCL